MSVTLALSIAVQAQPVRDLPIDLRIDVEEGPAQPIGDLRDFTVMGGRTFVLDFKDQVVHVYGPTGAFERTVGRKGSGPGEFRNANGLLAAPDGTVWVNDPGNARLTVLGAEGTFQRHHAFTANMYGYRWEGLFDTQRALRVTMYLINGDAPQSRTVRVGLDGRVRDTLPALAAVRPPGGRPTTITAKSPGRTSYRSYPFAQVAPPAGDPAGFTWGATDPASYEIRKTRDDGTVAVTARRAIAPTPIPGAIRDAAVRELENALKGTDHDADFSRIPRHYPFVEQLVVDDRSQLWARRALADSTRAEFDVFAPDGNYRYTARVAARLMAYGRLIVRDGALYAVALDDDDLPTIIRARIPR